MTMTETPNDVQTRLNVDFYLLASLTVIICGFGIMMVTSASSVISLTTYGSAWTMTQRQVEALALGGMLAFWISHWSIRVIRMWTAPLTMAVVALLVLVLKFGDEVAGQKNWIRLPLGFKLQPSEFAKLALVMFSAQVIAYGLKRKRRLVALLWPVLLVTAVVLVLVYAEKDLGTPIILAGIGISVLFASGVPGRLIGLISAGGAIFVIAVSLTGPDYRLNRFRAWLSPSSFPDTYGYQLMHGQYALADGGLFGHGLGHSTEKWGALPAPHTDFILAVIGQELGLIGTIGALVAIVAIIWAGFRIASHTEDDFSRMVAFGVSAWIAIQTIVNVGAIVRAVPITGVTLPFVSYGGSSLIPLLIAIGVLLAIARETSRIQTAKAQ